MVQIHALFPFAAMASLRPQRVIARLIRLSVGLNRSSVFARTMSNPARSNETLKINNIFDVSKITAVVTGGGTGIGLMITQALASNGAKVYITGRREEALSSVVEQYNTGVGKIVAAPYSINIWSIRHLVMFKEEISARRMMYCVLRSRLVAKKRKVSNS